MYYISILPLNLMEMAKKSLILAIITLLSVGLLPISQAKAVTDPLAINAISVKTDLAPQSDGAVVEISWTTNKPAYGTISYSTTAKELNIQSKTSGAPLSSYTARISTLKSEATYYFTITSYISGEQTTSFVRTFKTVKTKSTSLPVISEVHVETTTGTTATISWLTDVDTSGTIRYGLAENKLTKTASHSTRVKQHQITIKGLVVNTPYYYQISSRDKDGNVATYYVDRFTTLGTKEADNIVLAITDLKPNSVNDIGVETNQLTISFKTNKLATATISLTPPKGKVIKVATSSIGNYIHSYTVAGLTANTTYKANISVKDAYGATKKIDNITFATKALPVAQPIVTPIQTPQTKYSNAVRLVKLADHDTVYALVTNQSIATGQNIGWQADYFDYNSSQPANLSNSDKKYSTPADTGWFTNNFFVRSQIDANLNFGKDWYPLDNLVSTGSDHNNLFGAHWKGYVSASKAGEYKYTITSNNDSWVMANGKVITNNSGVRTQATKSGKVKLGPDPILMEIYFADRYTPGSVMKFSFQDSAVIVQPEQQKKQVNVPISQVKLHAIMNPAAFVAYGYDWKKIEIISRAELNRYTAARLVRTPNDATIYYLDWQNRTKIAIPNEAIFNSYGFNWADIRYVNDQDLQAYYPAKLVKANNSPAVYLLKSGQRYPIDSATTLTSLGYTFRQVITINKQHLATYTLGQQINQNNKVSFALH